MSALTPITKNFQDCDCEEAITEENFRAAEDLQEGISGRRRIDSTYENDGHSMVNAPRSGKEFPESDKDKPYRNW